MTTFLRCERCEAKLTQDDSIRDYIATGRCRACRDRLMALIEARDRAAIEANRREREAQP